MNVLPINIAIASPTPTTATATTGGTLAAATYYYKAVARMVYGPSGGLPGVTGSTGEFHVVAGVEASQITTGTTSTVTVTIPGVAGVTHYDLYRSTATGTEVYLTTVVAAAQAASTVFVDTGAITPGVVTAASITANVPTLGVGNSFVAGGQVGGLIAGQLQGGTAVTPFLAGRNFVISNPTAGTITVSYSPDGVIAGATVKALLTASYFDSQLSGFGGLPNFIVASAAGAYLIGSP